MGIEIIGKLTQKNNGDFKLVDLENVDYDGTGKSAKQELEKKIEDAKNSSTPYDDSAIKNDIQTLKDNEVTLVKDETSMEGIKDNEYDTLTTQDKTLIGSINEINAQYKDIANNHGWKNTTSGTITLIFDDCYKSFYDNCYTTILKPNNIKFGIPLCPNEISNTSRVDFCNADELNTLFADSNIEFMWHGLNHTTFNSEVSEDTLKTHIKQGLDFFKYKGLRSVGWVAPNTQFDKNKENIISQYFNFGYAMDSNNPNYDNYYKIMDKNKTQHFINRITLDTKHSMTDSVIIDGLNEVKKNNAWLTLYAHRIDETIDGKEYCPSSFIQELINWCNDNNIEILSPTDAFIKHNTNPIVLKYDSKTSASYCYDVPTILNVLPTTETNVAFLGSSNRKLSNFKMSGSNITVMYDGLYNININLCIQNSLDTDIVKPQFFLRMYVNNVNVATKLILSNTLSKNEYSDVYINRTLRLSSNDTVRFTLQVTQDGLKCRSTTGVRYLEINKLD